MEVLTLTFVTPVNYRDSPHVNFLHVAGLLMGKALLQRSLPDTQISYYSSDADNTGNMCS